VTQVKDMNDQSEREKQQLREATLKQAAAGGDKVKAKDNWSEAELQMLIKAVNQFPSGTNNRYV